MCARGAWWALLGGPSASPLDRMENASFIALLPQEVQTHLPMGRQATPGLWLVLPAADGQRDGIDTLNGWLRAQGWYPYALRQIVWYGDDGTGNLLGWDPDSRDAVLWNPEDGAVPWKRGSIEALWRFVLNRYSESNSI